MRLLLAACIGAACLSASAEPAPPADWKPLLQTEISRMFYDPHSLRDVRVSAPQWRHVRLKDVWISCFESNAKNAYGGYTGVVRQAYTFKDGKATNIGGLDICDTATMEPWPEMESQPAASVPPAQ